MPPPENDGPETGNGSSEDQPAATQYVGVGETQYIGQTVAIPAPSDQKAIRAKEAEVPVEWSVGDKILELYEVKAVHTGGGMGLVYRVHHTGWNLDLAVKCPRRDYFKTQEQKDNFVRECEIWIDLGLHPNTVSCFYVRTLGDIPRVFAEYVQGGSLSDWIKSRRLYEGGHQKALERILDIAIQFAWGLQYAHEKGLVHQDVKPANVMMAADGTPKVTDFGLARARMAAEEATFTPKAGQSVIIQGAGMCTPEYASPEQLDGSPLTKKTDIWSWGVSMLHVFMGELVWMTGIAAPEVLEDYLENGPEDISLPGMPEQIAKLLKHCFQRESDDRPGSMKEIVLKLQDAYKQTIGSEYTREEPKAADLLADGLNNKALSLLDLGRHDEVEKLFEGTIKADPQHPEASYNLGLLMWRSGRMTDVVLINRLEEIEKVFEGDWRIGYYIGLIHMERGDAESAISSLEKALQFSDNKREIKAALECARNAQGSWRSYHQNFDGHTDVIKSLNMGPDGSWIQSGSRDGTLRLWDLSTGQCTKTIKVETNESASTSLSPDGRFVIVSKYGLSLWDLTTGRVFRKFEGRTDAKEVCFSPDGKWVALASWDTSTALQLWEVKSGRRRTVFQPQKRPVNCVIFSPGSDLILSGGSDKLIKTWNLVSGHCVKTFEGHTNNISSLSVSSDGKLVLSGSHDNTIKLWNYTTGICIRTFKGHTDRVETVDISSDGMWILSGSRDKNVRLWDVTSGKCVRTFVGHNSIVCAVSFGLGSRSAFSAGDTLIMWNLKGAGNLALPAFALPRSAVEIKNLVDLVQETTKKARSLLEKGFTEKSAELVNDALRVPGFERNNDLLDLWRQLGKAGRRKGLLGSWLHRSLEVKTKGVPFGGISPLDRWTIATDGLMSSRNIRRALRVGERKNRFQPHEPEITSISISPDGFLAIIGYADRKARLYDLAWDRPTGRCLKEFRGSAEFIPNSHYVIGMPPNIKSLCLWDLGTERPLIDFSGHSDDISCFDISPDGLRLLSGSKDTTLKLWDISNGSCIRTIEGHSKAVTSVCFTPDGRFGLFGSSDGTIRLWDTEESQCLTIFENQGDDVYFLCFSPNGNRALSKNPHRPKEPWRIWELIWDYNFPKLAEWDEGARPYLEIFMTLHCPLGGDGINRVGKPVWNEDDFNRLITDLQYRGFGWLRPGGVRRELEKMTREWKGPSSLQYPPALSKKPEKAMGLVNDKTHLIEKKPIIVEKEVLRRTHVQQEIASERKDMSTLAHPPRTPPATVLLKEVNLKKASEIEKAPILAEKKEPGRKGAKWLVLIISAVFIIAGLLLADFFLKPTKPGPKEPFGSKDSKQQALRGESDPGTQPDKIAALEKETSQNPKNLKAWLELGNRYFDTEQNQKAIYAYKKYIKLDPRSANVWSDLGIMYRRTGDSKAAIEAFDEAMKLDSRHETSRFNKGIVLIKDMNDPEGALKAWEDLLQVNPSAKTPKGQPVKDMVETIKKSIKR